MWTYTIGDFANGSGQFLSHTYSNWIVPLTETIEVGRIEFTMQGSYHNLGFDLAIELTQDLSPFLASPVDPVNSTFDIQNGISSQGHIVSGSIVPRCPPPEHYGVGSPGSGSIVPTIATGGGDPSIGSMTFGIVGGQLLGGAFAATLMSPQHAAHPVVGIEVLVDPGQLLAAPVVAGGAAGIAGVGTTWLALPLPNLPGLVGTRFHFQMVALDVGAPGGVASASDGLTITICN